MKSLDVMYQAQLESEVHLGYELDVRYEYPD